jgi:hypothetical protein
MITTVILEFKNHAHSRCPLLQYIHDPFSTAYTHRNWLKLLLWELTLDLVTEEQLYSRKPITMFTGLGLDVKSNFLQVVRSVSRQSQI